jgi:hypothetical protein
MFEDWTALESFLKETGGGKGIYYKKSRLIEGQINNDLYVFEQLQTCSEKCGFGRLDFQTTDNDYKLYLRIQDKSDPMLVLFFMKTVWNLSFPKLIIGITGGANDFEISPELEMVLNELMQITQESDAWIVTGGTRGGIMKYLGMFQLSIF